LGADLGGAGDALFHDLIFVGIVEVRGRRADRYLDALAEAIVLVTFQRRAAGILHGDDLVPGVVDVLLAGLVRRHVAVGIAGRRCSAGNGCVFVLGVGGSRLRRAIDRDAVPVAEGVLVPVQASAGRAGDGVVGAVQRAATKRRQLAVAIIAVELAEGGIHHI